MITRVWEYDLLFGVYGNVSSGIPPTAMRRPRHSISETKYIESGMCHRVIGNRGSLYGTCTMTITSNLCKPNFKNHQNLNSKLDFNPIRVLLLQLRIPPSRCPFLIKCSQPFPNIPPFFKSLNLFPRIMQLSPPFQTPIYNQPVTNKNVISGRKGRWEVTFKRHQHARPTRNDRVGTISADFTCPE